MGRQTRNRPVDLIPEHVASRIVTIHEQLTSNVMHIPNREELAREQTRLWDEHFPGRPYEEIKRLVPVFLIAA